MKKGLLIHLGWLFAVVAAFAIGLGLERAGSAESGEGKNSGVIIPSASNGIRSSSDSQKKESGGASTRSTGSSSLSSEQMRAAVAALQNETDPVKRNYLFAKLLMDLTAENAEETYAALQELGG